MINLNYIFNEFPILETNQVLLRALTENELIEYFQMCQNEDYKQEFLSPGQFISIQDALKNILLTFPETFNQRKDITWAVISKKNKRLVGIRDLFIDSPNHPVVTQGYILPKYRNMGINQEILHVIIQFLKNANADKLEFNCSITNKPVLHIANKLNFRETTDFRIAKIIGRCKFSLDLMS